MDLMDWPNSNHYWPLLQLYFYYHWQVFRLTAGFLAKFYMLKAAMATGEIFVAGYFCSVDGSG